MADEDPTTRRGASPADRAERSATSRRPGQADTDEAPDEVVGADDTSWAAGVRAWIRATPAELVGLTVLLTGALVATGLVWWGSLARAERAEAANGVHGDPASGDAASTGLPLDAAGLQTAGQAAEVGHDHGPDHDGHGHGGNGAGPSGPTSDGLAARPDVASSPVMVHVSGAVAEPGLVTLPAGSRVADAVGAAGGMLTDGDHAAINLARLLDDGEHVHVPAVGEAPLPGPAGPPPVAAGPGAAAGGPVDLNRASVEELQTLPGIGPAKAAAIVEHRETVGPFAVPGDLRGVPGIGEKTFQALADRVVVR